MVVRDLQATMERLHTVLGWGPWKVYEHKPPAYQDLTFHGSPADYAVLGAETQVGPIAFELLQPLSGESPYQEWLDTHGEGLHHVACMMPTREGAAGLVARLNGLGAETLTAGRLADALDFYFLDARDQLGFILETGSGHSKELVKPLRVYPEHTTSARD
nr:VOC family protein [Streptomyces cupreus]